MGTFLGHAIPALFFIIIFGLFFVNGVLRFCRCRRNSKPFTSTLKIPEVLFCWRFKEWPTESFIRLVLMSISVSLEIYTGFHGGKFVHMGNAHHATMYASFAMVDVALVLQHYTKHVSQNTEYVMLTFAFMVEGILFSNHLHGRTSLDTYVHQFLVYAVFACALMTLASLKYRQSILLFVTQMYLVILQGTWFLQVGFILYNPLPGFKPWDPGTDHNTIMWVPLLFAWHCIGVLVVMSMVAGLILYCKEREYIGSGIEMAPILQNSTKGYSKVRMKDVISESDVEIETELP